MTEQVQTPAQIAVTAPEPVVELTPAEKRAAKIAKLAAQIEKLTADIEKLKQEDAVAAKLEGVKEGSTLIVRLGRAETARDVAATVTGVKTDDNGVTRYKVFSGSGFDAETTVILQQQIIEVTG